MAIIGISCPRCGEGTRVVDSYETKKGRARRRVCVGCEHRFSTIEMPMGDFHRLEAGRELQENLDKAVRNAMKKIVEDRIRKESQG